MSAIKVGTVQGGYEFMGGDSSEITNWKYVGTGTAAAGGGFRAGTGFGFPSTTDTLKGNAELFAHALNDTEAQIILAAFGKKWDGLVSAQNWIAGIASNAVKGGYKTLTDYANAISLWGSGGIPGKGSSTPKGKAAPTSLNTSGITIDMGGLGSTGGVGVSSMSAQAQMTAINSVDSYLVQWGLTGSVDGTPNGESFGQWVIDKVTAQGDNTNMQGVIDALRQTPGYALAFPGNAILMQEGKPIVDENTYKSTITAYQGVAQQYGLPSGFLTPTVMGNLIAHSVSTTEFQQRVQNGYSVAANAPLETRNLLKQYYGIDTGALAAYYLDPTNAATTLVKQTQAAVYGTEAVATGFGNLTPGQAEGLAGLNLNDQNGNVAASSAAAGFAKAATLTPLEHAAVGQRGQATVNQQQLVDYAFPGQNAAGGTNPAQEDAALKLALGARAAGLSGGGGYNTGAKGTSVGRVNTAGAQSRP